MDFSGFSLPPDAFYPQSSAHSATTWPGTFQRPVRVVKPTSRNISPRSTAQRRYKSLPCAPWRTRSVVDRRPTYAQDQNVYGRLKVRPTSWHSASYSVPTIMSDGKDASLESYANHNVQYTSREVNGLFTPLSMPRVDEPHIFSMDTPLNEMAAFDLNSYDPILLHADIGGRDYLSSHQYPTEQPVTQCSMPGATEPEYYDMYNQFQNTKIQTAPSSPNFLPIQFNAPASQAYTMFSGNENLQGEELVGMGLYDLPSDLQTSAWDASPVFRHRGSIGKGLKLEDSFVPPEDVSTEEAEKVCSGMNEKLRAHISGLEDGQQTAGFTVGDLQEQSFFFGDDDNDFLPHSESTLQPYSLSGWAPALAEGGYGWI